MNLKEFLLTKTRAEELCMICDPWRVAAVWIDHEDLFLNHVDLELACKEVEKDEWETLPICLDNGTRMTILAHSIYIK